MFRECLLYSVYSVYKFGECFCFTCIVLMVYNTKENSYSGQVFSLRMKQALVGMLSKDTTHAHSSINSEVITNQLNNYKKSL